VRHINSGNVADNAQMVKLVDTPASGAGDRKVVEVRVFFWAPIQASSVFTENIRSLTKTRESGFLRFCGWQSPPTLHLPPLLRPSPYPCGALEKQYRLLLLQVL
jgi:hypothetical protein